MTSCTGARCGPRRWRLPSLGAAQSRWHFTGYSRSQEAAKTRFTQLVVVDRVARVLPLSPVRRQLLIKDVKVFLRDVSQWVQLLPLLALVLLYLYNFSILDLDRVPYANGVVKNFYAFVNLAMAGFVIATVAVRFVFPAVSAEGNAFWIVRTSPISLRTSCGRSSGSACSRCSCSPRASTLPPPVPRRGPFSELVAAATIVR